MTPSQGSFLLKSVTIHGVADMIGASPRLVASWRSGAVRPGAHYRSVLEEKLGIASSAWERPAILPLSPHARALARSAGRYFRKLADELQPPSSSTAPAAAPLA